MHSSLFYTRCLSILFPVIVCRAELRLYEGFDYTVGEDQLAISGPWTGTGKRADIVDGNLIWQDALGNVLPVAETVVLPMLIRGRPLSAPPVRSMPFTADGRWP